MVPWRRARPMVPVKTKAKRDDARKRDVDQASLAIQVFPLTFCRRSCSTKGRNSASGENTTITWAFVWDKNLPVKEKQWQVKKKSFKINWPCPTKIKVQRRLHELCQTTRLGMQIILACCSQFVSIGRTLCIKVFMSLKYLKGERQTKEGRDCAAKLSSLFWVWVCQCVFFFFSISPYGRVVMEG